MKSIRNLLRPYDALLLVVALALAVLYIRAAGGGFPLDDSWIHQVYGRNLAQNGEWAFVSGEPSAASTSPLYTVLLSIGYRLDVPYGLWAHTLGVLTLFITGVLGARLAERLLSGKRWAAALTGLVLVLCWQLVWATVSGMETMLFSMFTLLLIALAWQERDAEDQTIQAVILRGVVFGIIAALATLARPEGVALTGIIGLLMLAARPHGLRNVFVWGVAAGTGFLLTMAPYLLLNVQLTGGLLPNTAAAKYAQTQTIRATITYPQRVLNMAQPLVIGGQFLLLPGIIYFAVSRLSKARRQWFDWLLLVWPVLLILLYAERLPAAYQYGRYVMPALPALIVAGVAGSLGLMMRTRRVLVGRVAMRALLASAVLVFVFFAVVTGPSTYARDVRIINEEMVTSAHWIEAHILPDELLAIHDIGAVGFFAPRPILDIAGLVNPDVIPLIGNEEALWGYMQEHGARYLMAFANQVPGGQVDDPRLCRAFTSGNPTAVSAGGDNMTVYALAWDEVCPA
jgi:hypothetical protein